MLNPISDFHYCLCHLNLRYGLVIHVTWFNCYFFFLSWLWHWWFGDRKALFLCV